MTILFVILIIVAAFVLGLIVLIQNPKGGGLAGSIGGFSNQLMGVKQTTDVLEKGTWIFAGVIGILCIISSLFMSESVGNLPDSTNKASGATVPGAAQPTAPAQLPANTTTLPAPDSPAK
jgi:preprotein translocase subunit SecG